MFFKHSSFIFGKSAFLLASSRRIIGKTPIIQLAEFHLGNNVNPIGSLLVQKNPTFYSKHGLCAAAAAPAENKTMKILEKAKPLITDQIKNEINATLVFCISGKNYLFDAHASRPLKVEMVEEPPKADVTMIADEDTFVKLAKGEMKSTVAFMSGKLKIKGNVQCAMRAEKMFKVIKNEAK